MFLPPPCLMPTGLAKSILSRTLAMVRWIIGVSGADPAHHKRESIEKMVGDFMRECGVLAVVFTILDADRHSWKAVLVFEAGGVMAFLAGVILERKRGR